VLTGLDGEHTAEVGFSTVGGIGDKNVLMPFNPLPGQKTGKDVFLQPALV